MKPVRVLARAAVSALGVGSKWHRAAPVGERVASRVRTESRFERLGLARPRLATVPVDQATSGDPAERFLLMAGEELLDELESCRPGFRGLRIGVAVGTSTGGMESQLTWFRSRHDGARTEAQSARKASCHAPFAAFIERLALLPHRQAHLLAACASSTVAIGIGCRWLELGDVDLAICGGYDALNLLVCAGFESLGATTATTPAPFRVGRDGMALGEGAALVALTLDDRERPGTDCILGFGASSDGFHVTAPEPEGALLARAAERALRDAGLAATGVDLTSAHGTATVFNDLAEAHALALLFPGGKAPAVDAAKAVLGHTLGASGALETVLTLNHLADQVLPAVAGSGEVMPELAAPLTEVTTRAKLEHALKLSAGFGGCNAALVLGTPLADPPTRAPRSIRVECVGALVTDLDWQRLAEHAVVDTSRLRHADAAAELVLAAALEVIEEGGALPADTAVVVASRTLGVRANHAFYTRLLERGVGAAAPRLFPHTSPNLCASQCSIAFGLTGPCFAVDEAPGDGLAALDVTRALLESGQCERLLLIALEEHEPVSAQIFQAAGWSTPPRGARAVLLAASAPTASPRLDWAGRQPGVGNLFELMADLGQRAGRQSEAGE